jgi:Adenylate cyclase, family 3 (some proteins contain HAMP domain)
MPGQTRQLAAIMFTDIVGYTAHMGNDEQKAFDFLRKNREIQKPFIEEFNGRLIKELGDGILAVFPTVSHAVQAAIRIQQSCKSTNAFQLRIGIHQGEIVIEDNDVFGDAVNIASRIQHVAVRALFMFRKLFTTMFPTGAISKRCM